MDFCRNPGQSMLKCHSGTPGMPGIREYDDIGQRGFLEVSGQSFGVAIGARAEAIDHMNLRGCDSPMKQDFSCLFRRCGSRGHWGIGRTAGFWNQGNLGEPCLDQLGRLFGASIFTSRENQHGIGQLRLLADI